jgi:hypothetical protein
MRYRTILVLMVAAACVGGCTGTGSAPATAPSSTAPGTTTPMTSTPTTTITATTAAPTTTIDRITEITRIFEDLERRRLAAIYAGDRDAFRTLFADTPYLDRSLEVFDLVAPGTPPAITIEVIEVLRDDDTCLAASTIATIGDPGVAGRITSTVLVPSDETWVYAYAFDGNEGWLCDGPHPLQRRSS